MTARLRDRAALARRPVGAVVVGGPDRLRYLDAMLSQRFAEAEPGDVADFLLLEPKGEILAMGRALVRTHDVVLLLPPALSAAVADLLEERRFLLEVDVSDQSDSWALVSVRHGGNTLEIAGTPDAPMRADVADGRSLIRDRWGGVDIVGAPDPVTQCAGALGLEEADASDWDAWRIQAGVPAWGSEVVAGRRAQELGLLPTHVHLRKGCYPGQESIAKIHNLGHTRRRLMVLEADRPLHPGDPVADGARGAEITSAAPLSAGVPDGPAIAMALVALGADGRAPSPTVRVGNAVARPLFAVGAGLAQPGG